MKRTLTSRQIADQRRGAGWLGPGVWIDRHGGLHFSLPELLAHFEIEDTPENRERMTRTIREQMSGCRAGRRDSRAGEGLTALERRR